MKITPNNKLCNYFNQNESIKNMANSSSQKKITKNFDELIIHSKASVLDDKFVSDLTADISKEVKASASKFKLEDIKSQIDSGTYQIGIDEIVKKMMLC